MTRATGIAAEPARPMTAGPIARGNLSVMIIATQERLRDDPKPVTGDELVGLLLTRSRVSGSGADAERADRVAADLVERFPNNARAQLAQARVDNMFHRFGRALTRLHQADAGGVQTSEVLEERASVLQAQGRTHEALALWTAIRADHPDSHSAGRLACAYAASGDWVTARVLLAAGHCRGGLPASSAPPPRSCDGAGWAGPTLHLKFHSNQGAER